MKAGFQHNQNEKPGSSFDEPGSFRDLKRGNVKLFDGGFRACITT